MKDTLIELFLNLVQMSMTRGGAVGSMFPVIRDSAKVYLESVLTKAMRLFMPCLGSFRKPSMTFGATSGTSSNSNGTKGSNGKGKGNVAGTNGKNNELAARHQKGAAQTNARKRRILGVGSMRIWDFLNALDAPNLGRAKSLALAFVAGDGTVLWGTYNDTPDSNGFFQSPCAIRAWSCTVFLLPVSVP